MYREEQTVSTLMMEYTQSHSMSQTFVFAAENWTSWISVCERVTQHRHLPALIQTWLSQVRQSAAVWRGIRWVMWQIFRSKHAPCVCLQGQIISHWRGEPFTSVSDTRLLQLCVFLLLSVWRLHTVDLYCAWHTGWSVCRLRWYSR